MRTRYLVCYDIANPGRLRQVARICESYGSRLQFSVFECVLDRLTLQKFKTRIADVLKVTEDQVMFVAMGPESSTKGDAIEVVGRALEPRVRVTVV